MLADDRDVRRRRRGRRRHGARMIVCRALPGTKLVSVLVVAADSSRTNGFRTTFSV